MKGNSLILLLIFSIAACTFAQSSNGLILMTIVNSKTQSLQFLIGDDAWADALIFGKKTIPQSGMNESEFKKWLAVHRPSKITWRNAPLQMTNGVSLTYPNQNNIQRVVREGAKYKVLIDVIPTIAE